MRSPVVASHIASVRESPTPPNTSTSVRRQIGSESMSSPSRSKIAARNTDPRLAYATDDPPTFPYGDARLRELDFGRWDGLTYDQLKVANPKLWWPKQMGEPYLHELTLDTLRDEYRLPVLDAEQLRRISLR